MLGDKSNIFPQTVSSIQIRPHVDALVLPRAARDIRPLLPSVHAHLCFHAARGDASGGGWSVGQRFHALYDALDHVFPPHV